MNDSKTFCCQKQLYCEILEVHPTIPCNITENDDMAIFFDCVLSDVQLAGRVPNIELLQGILGHSGAWLC